METHPKKLKEEHLNIYNGIQCEILSTTRFDKNSDLSTTYLERIDMTRDSKIKGEQTFPISEQGYTAGKLLDGTECQILLDTEASKSLCLNHTICIVNYFICYQNLHLKHREFMWVNRPFISVLFIIPTIVDIHRHRF